MGYLLLEGGAEFGGRMAEADRAGLARAGGPRTTVHVIAAAAAPDHNEQRAGRNATRWFKSLGVQAVSVLPLTDRAGADDPSVAAELRSARFIYLLGGFTHYLGQTLLGSLSEAALRAAHAAGAVIAGSSAGAMVLCEHYYDPEAGQLRRGLGFLPNALIIPHHDTFGRRWASPLAPQLPGSVLIGIDEQTGMLDQRDGRAWQVLGRGAVTLYWQGQEARYSSGSTLALPLRPGPEAPDE